MFYYWTQGLLSVIEPHHLLIIVIGSSIGILAGGIPGVSGTMAIALAIPMTYAMGPTASLLLLVSLYASSVYAGSISGILFILGFERLTTPSGDYFPTLLVLSVLSLITFFLSFFLREVRKE